MHNAEYLEALGVVQYRRRELNVNVQRIASEDNAKSAENSAALHEPAFSPTQHALKGEEALEIPTSESSQVHTISRDEAATHPSQPPEQIINFDLLVWKTDRLLVWEISTGQKEQVSAKHLLVNNVLKALWPNDFKGAQMLHQEWPLSGVDASKASARDWLGSMLSGHLQQASKVPVWLMGDSATELILGAQDGDDSLTGSRVKHPQLDLELFIGPSPQAMFDSPISKTQTWQLLRELRHG